MNLTDIKQLLADEEAVSPVIGVILMVAITVILAAVIGTFVLGLGDNVQNEAPQANFQFSYGEYNDGGTLRDSFDVTHNGGQNIDPSNVEVQAGSDNAVAWSDASDGDTAVTSITTGTSVTYTYGNGADFETADSGDTVRVIWQSPAGGSSNTIGSSQIP